MSGKKDEGAVQLSTSQKIKQRVGLTTEQAEELYKTVGFNELPHIEVSLWYILFCQFTGKIHLHISFFHCFSELSFNIVPQV